MEKHIKKNWTRKIITKIFIVLLIDLNDGRTKKLNAIKNKKPNPIIRLFRSLFPKYGIKIKKGTNATNDFLNEIINNVKPDFLQLHGNENPNRCNEIKEKFKLPIIKGIGIKDKTGLIKSNRQFEDICDMLLFDAPSTNLPGGNGEKFNWKILREFKSKKKWMLAGGLNINNISEAINITKPPAIDISSGLEIKKGVKNTKLIKDFVIKCRNI